MDELSSAIPCPVCLQAYRRELGLPSKQLT